MMFFFLVIVFLAYAALFFVSVLVLAPILSHSLALSSHCLYGSCFKEFY